MQQQIPQHQVEQRRLRIDVSAKAGHVVCHRQLLSEVGLDVRVLRSVRHEGAVPVQTCQEGEQGRDRNSSRRGHLVGCSFQMSQQEGDSLLCQRHGCRVLFFLPKDSDLQTQQPRFDLAARSHGQERVLLFGFLDIDVHAGRFAGDSCSCNCIGIGGAHSHQQGPARLADSSRIQEARRGGGNLIGGCVAGRPRGSSQPSTDDLGRVRVRVQLTVFIGQSSSQQAFQTTGGCLQRGRRSCRDFPSICFHLVLLGGVVHLCIFRHDVVYWSTLVLALSSRLGC